ncbi:MAG: hypothetical protein B0W54_23640 [Cellvibrio sp. 79]|nr:MAG: hypothetical protein B0W54_23640 [Cellvibrio sp. 79]
MPMFAIGFLAKHLHLHGALNCCTRAVFYGSPSFYDRATVLLRRFLRASFLHGWARLFLLSHLAGAIYE